MKALITVGLTLLCISFQAFSQAEEVPLVFWFEHDRFTTDSFYIKDVELYQHHEHGVCFNDECEAYGLGSSIYLKALLINEKNYNPLLIGVWTGGECSEDYWSVKPNGDFSSAFPYEGSIYSWSGQYSFKGSNYVEKGLSSEGFPEHNEANLYYVPYLDVVIYKGTLSLVGVLENGEPDYVYYDTVEYPYMQSCE